MGWSSPLGGVLGDRIGFRTVLTAALAGGGVVLALMPLAPAVAALAGLAVVFAASTATVSAMVFGLLAVEVPPERRSATLNLVYLPLYAAGIIGPALGAGVVTIGGLPGPFLLGAAVFIGGAIVIGARRTPSRAAGSDGPWRAGVRGAAALSARRHQGRPAGAPGPAPRATSAPTGGGSVCVPASIGGVGRSGRG